ncbi:MAG: cation:proton antiporter domain-containing protein [Planctomycetota bacterium]|jgi:Kef-type K+ transport system membrane component KefB
MIRQGAFGLALIFAGAAALATVFLYLRQPIIVAYIGLGMLMGPWGLKVVKDPTHIDRISHIGIILLMFLIGLNLHVQKLVKLLRTTSLITFGTCVVFAAPVALLTRAFGFSWFDSLVVGMALMFSSTVISIKLIPTTTLHQKHMGEVMISVLLLQDIIALLIILLLYGAGGDSVYVQGAWLLVKTAALFVGAWLAVRYGLLRLLGRFDVIQDYLFLMSLGWCLLCAEAAYLLGLSHEIGAFTAGIALGTAPISLVISEGLKPVREFFLILFFFSIGARFDFLVTEEVVLPGLLLAALLLVLKPVAFWAAFRLGGESPKLARGLALRLGQASEFSILVAYSAINAGRIEPRTAYLIQLTAILTFIASTYIVVYKCPTPIGLTNKARQD